MCLIAFALATHPRWPLVLIGNRDEAHARPTAPADFQPDAPHVYGGRDLEKQGGWLQVSEHGRLAAVTNVRDGLASEHAPRSRGQLVAQFVRAEVPVPAWLAMLQPQAESYGRFNLLAWDGRDAFLASNHPQWTQRRVVPGVHGLSNGDFDAEWPKVRRARDALQAWCNDGAADFEVLFEALADTDEAPDAELPDTGIDLELERTLSAPFITGERYGTRCSSVVLVGRDQIRFVERRFGPEGRWLGDSDERFERR